MVVSRVWLCVLFLLSRGAAADEQGPRSSPRPPRYGLEARAGIQTLWADAKAIPALTLRVGRGRAWLDLEVAGVWLTEPSRELDVTFLGNEFGAALLLSPVSTRRFELRLGAGGDFFYLWHVHANEWQTALSTRAALHAWLGDRVGLFAAARAYPLHTRGLGLGVTRAGRERLPILFSTGVEWGFR